MKNLRRTVHALATLGLACAGLGMTAAVMAQLPSTGTRAVPTFESVGLYWSPGSNVGTAGCLVQFRRVGDTAWRNGLPMWYDSRNGECRGSLVHLTPNTTYEAQFSLPGQSPSRQLQFKTWSENFPIARTVTLPPGTSRNQINITQGGTASGYVLYTTDPTTPSVIDVANGASYNIQISAPYVIVRGLTLKGAQADAIRLTDAAHDVVIENNDISGWGRSSGRTSSMGYTIGADLDSGVRASCSSQSLVRVVVQRNRIHDPRYGANSWTDGHPAGPQGISFYSDCGGNHVFRFNEIYSSTSSGHYFNDGIGGGRNFSSTGFPNHDTDIYGNRIERTWDDCIEAEGGNNNVRIWNNYCNSTTTGIASTSTAKGPLYIFRNVYNRSRMYENKPLDQDTRNLFAKSGNNSSYGGGRRYIFHNTLLQATQSGVTNGLGAGHGIYGTGTSEPIVNTVSRNNIFHVWNSGANVIRYSAPGNDYDYDLYNGPLTASGDNATELHGMKGTPTYASGNGWTSEAGGMYQLATGSPGYDKGVRIPNFNDSFTGTGPDVGAHEAGTAAMVFGVKGGSAPAEPPTPPTTPPPPPPPTTPTDPAPPPTPTPTSSPYNGTPAAVPGTFEAENFDKGGEGLGYHDTTPGNQGGQYRLTEDVDIIRSADTAGGGYVVYGMNTGEWLGYTINVASNDNYVLQLRLANDNQANAAFHVEVDGKPVTTALVAPVTGSLTSFRWVSTPAFALTTGLHKLKIVADQQFFRINTIALNSSTPSSTPFSGTPIAVPGTFEAENFDRGGEGLGYHDTTKGNAGNLYRTAEDVDIVRSADTAGGGYVVYGFNTGEWLAYTINVATTGNYILKMRMANDTMTTAAFHVEVDGRPVTGSVRAPVTGSLTNFVSVSSPPFALSAGRHVLKIVADQQFFRMNTLGLVASP